MEPEKSIMQTLEELRDDLKQFIETRYELLRVELSGILDRLVAAAVVIGAAAVLGLVGLILLGICISFAIGLGFGAFPNQAGIVWGFLITGSCAVLLAGLMGAGARAKLKAEDLAPNRTLRVLRRDQDVMREVKEGGQQDERIRRRA